MTSENRKCYNSERCQSVFCPNILDKMIGDRSFRDYFLHVVCQFILRCFMCPPVPCSLSRSLKCFHKLWWSSYVSNLHSQSSELFFLLLQGQDGLGCLGDQWTELGIPWQEPRPLLSSALLRLALVFTSLLGFAGQRERKERKKHLKVVSSCEFLWVSKLLRHYKEIQKKGKCLECIHSPLLLFVMISDYCKPQYSVVVKTHSCGTWTHHIQLNTV